MSFASATFFLFLALVFALHWLARGARAQNAVLVAASFVFYGWWDWRFCGLLAGSALVDYHVGRALHAAPPGPRRRLLLAASLGFNLGVLGVFKYLGFFADSLQLALAGVGIEAGWTLPHLILPLGISFYTFQTLSYTLDIWRGRLAPRRDLLAYLSFVTFFPQLVAGPIERAAHLLPQFLAARKFDRARAESGCRLILWGLAKKMLLADNLGAVVDQVYAVPGAASPAALAWATVFFAFQIYGDFSGYSDIAAGTARLFGIELMRNFHLPYFSQSVTEFWRRWHVSMSTWFRDYVYIPLGGGRGGHTARSLLLTTLASGLWHGAAWHFVAWGLLHGLFLLAERRLGARGPLPETPGGEGRRPGWRATGRMLRTFLLVNVAWAAFRVPDTGDLLLVYAAWARGLVTPAAWAEAWRLALGHAWLVAGCGALLAAEWLARRRWDVLELPRWPAWTRWLLYTVMVWAVLVFGTRRTAEFIYFQF